jgi:chromosome segregation ATPase
MNTNTIDGPKGPRTLDQARWRISELEEQLNLRGPGQSELTLLRAKISNLESELEKKEAEIGGLKVQLSVYRNRSAAQASAPDLQNMTPASMTRAQLEKSIEGTNKRGDTETVGRLYQELKTRPLCG